TRGGTRVSGSAPRPQHTARGERSGGRSSTLCYGRAAVSVLVSDENGKSLGFGCLWGVGVGRRCGTGQRGAGSLSARPPRPPGCPVRTGSSDPVLSRPGPGAPAAGRHPPYVAVEAGQ